MITVLQVVKFYTEVKKWTSIVSPKRQFLKIFLTTV